ncbi:patatin-like phospholipase family protein [Aliivibrio sifiae]|uniref:patatin-like phospholipase family protein n=1 Tax=Aliivibrio sifiae TaxID=566293 RepID=UPI003D103AEB
MSIISMLRQWPFIILCTTSLIGCSTSASFTAVPSEQSDQVYPLGKDNLRYWGDSSDLFFDEVYLSHFQQEKDDHHYLALSGGGANGAYGAGILTAWSEMGGRPDFDIVTGVSTGALIAVFAYLGEDYDDELTEFYTTTETDDIFITKRIFNMLSGTALLDSSPLENTIRETVTSELLDKVAEYNAQGRLLLVGTTDLGSQRLSIWNMGEIAALKSDESQRLFEDIILASASIPGAFPAVRVNVESDEETYQELHVDGGVTRQVFLISDSLSVVNNQNKNHHIYVIRNGEFEPKVDDPELNLNYVASRSLSTLIKYQGRGDVMRIYNLAQRSNIDFYFSHMESNMALEVEQDPDQPFDSTYMQYLYKYGYEQTLIGNVWDDKPPQFNTFSVDL